MTFRRDLSEEAFGHVDTWRKSISGRGHGRHTAVGSSGLRTVQEDWGGAGRPGAGGGSQIGSCAIRAQLVYRREAGRRKSPKGSEQAARVL